MTDTPTSFQEQFNHNSLVLSKIFAQLPPIPLSIKPKQTKTKLPDLPEVLDLQHNSLADKHTVIS